MEKFEGFPEGLTSLIRIPELFFSDVVPNINNIDDLRLLLYIFWRIEKTEEPEEEIIRLVVGDFATRVRKAREKLGLKQEDFAKKIKEKESIVHKLETGEFKPNLDLAKKLEKIFLCWMKLEMNHWDM